MGGGQATQQHFNRTMGAYMPAHYVKQFLPKYSSRDEVDKKAKAAGFDGWLSYIKNRWDWRLNPELPTLGPWKTVEPDQHADLGVGAQPLLLRHRQRGEPASVHRQDQHGGRREPGSPEPPGHRRAVRPAGAAHRHGEDSRLPREPQQGQLRRAPRPGLERLGRHAAGQPRVRGEIPRWRSGCTIGTSAGRSPSASTATSSTRPSGSGSAWPAPSSRPTARPTARGPSGARSGPRTIRSRPTSCWTRSAWRRRTARATACGRTARGGCASSYRPRRGPSSPTPRSPR